MKHYLLLFLSTLLILFTLAQPQKPVKGFACAEKSVLKAAVNSKKIKRTCARKCLKHQTHSEQQNATNAPVDCSQQQYAVVADKYSTILFESAAMQQYMVPVQLKLPAPHLGADPDPPRIS